MKGQGDNGLRKSQAEEETGDKDEGHGSTHWLFNLDGLETAACVKGAIAFYETHMLQEIEEIGLE